MRLPELVHSIIKGLSNERNNHTYTFKDMVLSCQIKVNYLLIKLTLKALFQHQKTQLPNNFSPIML
jgi:hypothetical protein